MRSKLYILALAISIISTTSVRGDDGKETLNRAYAKSVSGDIRPILAFFNSMEEVSQSEFADLFERYHKRFVTNEEQFEIENPFISELHQHYTRYWKASLLNPKDEPESRKTLVRNIKNLAKREGRKTSLFSFNKLDAAIIRIAEENGYHLKLGVVRPLRELMIWRKEKKEVFEVELPGEAFSAEVIFLQDFLCKGWLGYATFDEKHTGGWATNEVIYRVGGKPDTDDEWFRVSLVGHEGRHVSDGRKYGSLPGWKLEYRAKLTELILADESFWKLLNNFKREAREDKKIPHIHASFLLIGGLLEHLEEVVAPESYSSFQFETYSAEELKQAVKILLEESTKSLDRKE